jgi:4'-phosphopantetheinyl transferase
MNASGAHPGPEAGRADEMIGLAPDEIHVWLVFEEDVDDSVDAACWSLLTPDERRQAQAFFFADDRRRYVATRALVRVVLSRYAPIRREDWRFSTNAYGRPFIANPLAKDLLLFNISHTRGLIALGVTRDRSLGVDVENLRRRDVSCEIAERYFAPPEVASLAAAPPHEQQYRFFEYWTFKEAYIKARGLGLSLPLDKFSFHYPNDTTVEIAIDAALADVPARWAFWQVRPGSDYLLAICAERQDGVRPPRVIIRQAVPMVTDRTCVFECSRMSRNVHMDRGEERDHT